MTTIKEKLWNIDLVIEDIKNFPQTYETILGDESCSGTCQIILRRKLNNLFKEGRICKTTIPGTRFGKAIFYVHPKNYFIIVEGTRIGSNVFVFFSYKKVGNYHLKVEECWKLNKKEWIKEFNRVFFEGDVLKFI